MTAKKSLPAKPEPRQPTLPAPKIVPEGVRRQRRHIKDLTGEDPLRAGIAD